MADPQNRALVVGVANYDNLGETKIPGALTSARAWVEKLLEYGYRRENITLFEDAQATKQSVLEELERLFTVSGDGDDVTFLIASHGTSMIRNTAIGDEQGLVLYPKRGDTLLDATLFADEIAATAATAKYGDKIQFNVGQDACFSGSRERPRLAIADDADLGRLLKRLVPMRIIAPGASGRAKVSFVKQLLGPLEQPSRPSTVIVTACEADEVSYEGEGSDGQRWTLFSEAALKALRNDPDHSYRTLVDEGVPPYLPHESVPPYRPLQTPKAYGSRRNYHFARRTVRHSSGGNKASMTAAKTSRTTATSAVQQSSLDVLIVGISCIADPRTAGVVKKRVLFPTDNLWYPSLPPHLGFVEFEESDLLNDPGTIIGLSERYTRFGRVYRRFELSRHRITIDNIDPTQGFEDTTVYRDHVPQMLRVQPDLSECPREECYLAAPPAWLVTGHFDITHGILGVRRVASTQSYFSPTPPNTWLPGYFAISAQLTVRVNDIAPTIRVENLDTGFASIVKLKPTVSEISIGNLTAPVLAGDLDDDDPPHDFKLFYNLAEYDVDPKPVPNKTTGIETACFPVNWP